MAQNYPFTRANPSDWSPGQRLPSAQANTMDKNAAQAADGLLWSDVAIVKNFSAKSTIANCGAVSLWEASTSRWIAAGVNALAPTFKFSTDGRDDWQSVTGPAVSNWSSSNAGASNGVGTVVIGGDTASGATKICQSADGGSTWATRSTVASGGSFGVVCLAWMPSVSLFVAGLNNTAATNIETSPDGITWTQRTGLPNTNARNSVACSSSAAVMLAAVSTDKALRSVDGATWVEVTMPSAAVWRSIAWDAVAGLFVALAASGVMATSADGVTWSSSGLVSPFGTSNFSNICTLRRMWVVLGTIGTASAARVSVDRGATWLTVKTIDLLTARAPISTGDNQLLITTTGLAYASLRGGL